MPSNGDWIVPEGQWQSGEDWIQQVKREKRELQEQQKREQQELREQREREQQEREQQERRRLEKERREREAKEKSRSIELQIGYVTDRLKSVDAAEQRVLHKTLAELYQELECVKSGEESSPSSLTVSQAKRRRLEEPQEAADIDDLLKRIRSVATCGQEDIFRQMVEYLRQGVKLLGEPGHAPGPGTSSSERLPVEAQKRLALQNNLRDALTVLLSKIREVFDNGIKIWEVLEEKQLLDELLNDLVNKLDKHGQSWTNLVNEVEKSRRASKEEFSANGVVKHLIIFGLRRKGEATSREVINVVHNLLNNELDEVRSQRARSLLNPNQSTWEGSLQTNIKRYANKISEPTVRPAVWKLFAKYIIQAPA